MIKKFLEKVLHAPKASAGMFDEVGAIKLDPTPMVEHLPDIAGQPSMREALEAFLSRESYRRLQEQAGEETFQDFTDFGDDREEDFPGSPYSLSDEAQVYEVNRLANLPPEVKDPALQEPLPKKPRKGRDPAPKEDDGEGDEGAS